MESVLVTGSSSERVAFPFAGPYHASKFALEGLADSPRAEPPSKVAEKIAAALDAGGARYPVGRGARTLATLRPLLPDLVFDRLAGLVSR
jgi:hypothetical protein